MSGLYLCDPRKNAHCSGTVCFYRDEALWHWCMATDDPACAITGPEGEPLAICPEALDGMILREAERKLAANMEREVINSTAYTMATIFNCIAESESDLMVDPYLNSQRSPIPARRC